jgi:hypothetical protein
MFTSDFGEFRRKQAIADLRHHTRSFPLATVRRIGAGIDARREGANLQQRLEWYFRGKLPLSNLRSDAPASGAVLMASALPDEDFESFLAATVLLVLERLTSENGPDDGFWTWRRLAPHYRLAGPSVRAAIMCGFREARRFARIALDEGPEPGDCMSASRDETLAISRDDHPALALVRSRSWRIPTLHRRARSGWRSTALSTRSRTTVAAPRTGGSGISTSAPRRS